MKIIWGNTGAFAYIHEGLQNKMETVAMDTEDRILFRECRVNQASGLVISHVDGKVGDTFNWKLDIIIYESETWWGGVGGGGELQ